MVSYFLEHKEGGWLTIEGELTNDPHHAHLLFYMEKYSAEDELKPRKREIRSDFAGNHFWYDMGADFMINHQQRLMDKCKENGFDLYFDFIVTEHEFVVGK